MSEREARAYEARSEAMTLNEGVQRGRRLRWTLAVLVAVACVATPAWAWAYVGPGAGIAFMTTALALLSTIALVTVGSLVWPLRWLWRTITRKRPPKKARIRRAVIIGLDGLDPRLAQRWIEQGKLPHLERLARVGSFQKLGTTWPAMSPVAWSSFSTGVNPGKHGIFDFLTRDRHTYMPDLSSADVGPPRRWLDLGKWRIPLGKPRLRLLRRSKPFWQQLSTYRIPASILRVPITFPPDRFEGTMLSAMCVPDLQGSQGTFTFFAAPPLSASPTSPPGRGGDGRGADPPLPQTGGGGREAAGGGGGEDPYAVGQSVEVQVDGDRVTAVLEGPLNPIRNDGVALKLPFEVVVDRAANTARLEIGGQRVALAIGEYTDWVEIAFPMGLGLKLRGIARFRLLELEPGFKLYVSPVNIDPSRPILPISHPRFFSIFLAKLIGRYTTLGLAEDTWALNEGVLDDEGFLEQAWSNHAEREAMLFQMLRRTRKGLVACVFDGTDRIQHMFMRYTDPDHPAVSPEQRAAGAYRDVIEETYTRCDAMLGRIFEEVDIHDPRNLVVVMSDHGFESFRRGINLNAWLHDHGYLAVRDDVAPGEWFRGVDWSRTQAFAVGLGGIFLNVRGREARGIVEPGDEARELAKKIARELRGLQDPGADDAVAIQEMYLAHEVYEGPYVDDAPELIVGYAAGWRASWDGARGVPVGEVFTDNTKAWSGDHCIDPTLVPGVLFANHRLDEHDRLASIMDVAPTVLDFFGIPTPRYMDGQSLAPPATASEEAPETTAKKRATA